MNSLTDPIIRVWQWWFIPRSADPTVRYRERALRILLPIVTILRILAIVSNYSSAPEPYFPLWVALAASFIPILITYIFIIRGEINLGRRILSSALVSDRHGQPAH